nr:CRISPR-associated RAMP protein Csx7 [Candidatus Baldrarchaeota archaeon]
MRNLFVEKYIVKGKIVNLDPLSIGAGKGALTGAIDNPIVRLNNIPYIPGSSLKGVLRTEAERYARILGLSVCDIFKGEELDWKKEAESKNENYEPCVICRIFGGPTISSAIIVHNLYAKDAITESRTCVSISRVTGAQIPGRLFDIEYVVPNTEFTSNNDNRIFEIDGRISLEDRDKDETKIILYLLNKLRMGEVVLGGRKSVGMGRVQLKIERVEKMVLENGEVKIGEVKLF